MSGGVDSSTVAAMLVREGRPVVGLTMQLWNQRRLPGLSIEGATGRCCSLDDVYDAAASAEQIGIPYYVVNFEREFEDRVIKRSWRTTWPAHAHSVYALQQLHQVRPFSGDGRFGRRPEIATGHYARIRFDAASDRWQLLRGVDHARTRPTSCSA